MKKSVQLFGGIVGSLLIFGLVLTGCKSARTSFHGDTLAGTRWEFATSGSDPSDPSRSISMKRTLNFTSATAGTDKMEINWIGNWTQEEKDKYQLVLAIANGDGTFTFIYDSATHSGTITHKPILGIGEDTSQDFTVDVVKKILTLSGDKDGELMVLKLK